jgi:hypothetical protein
LVPDRRRGRWLGAELSECGAYRAGTTLHGVTRVHPVHEARTRHMEHSGPDASVQTNPPVIDLTSPSPPNKPTIRQREDRTLTSPSPPNKPTVRQREGRTPSSLDRLGEPSSMARTSNTKGMASTARRLFNETSVASAGTPVAGNAP